LDGDAAHRSTRRERTKVMFHYKNHQLMVGQVPLEMLAAEFGSPLYIYDAADLRLRCQELLTAFGALQPHIHFSVKANSNLSLLRLLADEGVGFDIVSGGELARLQAAGIATDEVSFAGVGKSIDEIEAALKAGIGFFNVESGGELDRIAGIATRLACRAQVLLRLNPDVDAGTHKYITTGKSINKFGLDFDSAAALCEQFAAHPWLRIVGFHMHLGSQIKQTTPYVEAVRKILDFVAARRAAGQEIGWLNLGGGFGIGYQGEAPLSPTVLAAELQPLLHDQNLQLILEPGRTLVARAGVLVMQVQYIKTAGDKNFCIVDSGMHHMIRPALYGGWHKIWPLTEPEAIDPITYDVVGPICESTDFLAQDRPLPPLKPGDLLALFDAGAYGFVMASNYNTQPRPAEVLVDGDCYRLVRRRETPTDLLALELPYLS
jgi:diaminopimelate decarboxylase